LSLQEHGINLDGTLKESDEVDGEEDHEQQQHHHHFSQVQNHIGKKLFPKKPLL